MILSEDITKELLEELIAEHRQDEVALSSAILMEALEMNRISSLEGLDKCYSGLVDAGSGIVSNEGGENVKHIIHSITILFLTTLPNQTGDTLHVLGKLYNLCGTPRYRRRFVTRIAPLLLRPSNSAPWCIEHRNDMESILAVVQLIFNQITGTVFGEKQWYRRGQSLREDEERQHTISLAAAYLQSLHESDITGLSDNGSYHSSQNGPHEMHEKLDMLIRGAIHGMTSGEVGYSVVGATLVKKKAPMSPRVKLPHQQSSHEVNTPSATLEHSPTMTASQAYPPAPLTPKPSHPSPLHTPCSSGSPPKSPYRKVYSESNNQKHIKRSILGPEERYRIVMACRALKEQIDLYEKRFIELNKRQLKKADKTRLSSTYTLYADWKKVIRNDAARRIQAVIRGYLCRKTLIEHDVNGTLARLVKKKSSILRKENLTRNVVDGVIHGMNDRSQPVQPPFAVQPIVRQAPEIFDSSNNSFVVHPNRFVASGRTTGMVPVTSAPINVNAPSYTENRHRRQVSDSSEGSNDSSDASSASGRRSMVLQDLLRQKRELKSQLKLYDHNFRRKHGRMPVKSEKEPIRHLYETYNSLKARILQCESDMDSIQSHSDGSKPVSPRTPNSSTMALYNSHTMLEMLRQEKNQLHKMLRTYERNFLQTHERQVSSFEDIRPVAAQYRRYKEIKRTIGKLQEEGRAFNVQGEVNRSGAV